MLTKTTLAAIRLLIHLVLVGDDRPRSPRRLGEQLGLSPTYTMKVARLLTRAGLLRSHRGTRGGIVLAERPRDVRLLDIVEATQGPVLGDFCDGDADPKLGCTFHRQMHQVHRAIHKTLSATTLADLARKPGPSAECHGGEGCLLQPLGPGVEGP